MGHEHTSARLSDDRRYRYLLVRRWDNTLPDATFVMLNPSTADERDDDPTIRKCIGFAKRWGCGGIKVVNLYAFRATNPRDCFAAADPIGGPQRSCRGALCVTRNAWGSRAAASRGTR